MDQQGPEDIAVSGTERPRMRHGRALVIGCVVLALAGAGVGIATAATSSSPTPSPSPTNSPNPPLHGRNGLRLPDLRGGLGLGAAIHGEFTVKKADGTYEVIDVQQGSVTAVSSSSITLKSADGFTKTYAVTNSTLVRTDSTGITSVKNNDNVTLEATVANGKATAISVVDLTQVKTWRGQSGRPNKPSSESPSTTSS